jgi:hypothetical protein
MFVGSIELGHTTMASANNTTTVHRAIREREEIRATLRAAGLLKIDEDVLTKCM